MRRRAIHLHHCACAALIAGSLFPAIGAAPAVAAAPAFRNYPQQPKAPADAPNVLLILTDDVGFSASTSYGGAIPTPVFDALGKSGLRYNAFHTTGMCSPTRAALLTGRNHHAVEAGAISNLATDQKGYTSVLPASAATIGRVLKLNGYDTAWVGKNHNTPVWETGPTGPFDRWPNAMGFDYFYGFNLAMTDQFAPDLVENRNPVEVPSNDPGYHLERDLADRLLNWLRIHRTVQPDRPFFAYWAPAAMHSPHQAPADWIERFRGQYDQGWDRLREETFARQKAQGIIPANAVLTPRPDGMPAWTSLTPAEQRVASRMMEAAAAQLAYSDHQIGRVIDWLKQTGQFENTLIIFVQGDNGASDESPRGANNEMASLQGIEPSYAELERGIESHGGRFSSGNYAAAWGWATNTPFQWGKEVASHLGGLRDGLAVSWPRRIRQAGTIRTQFSHVIDIAPTIYEAAGITPPAVVDGVPQQPIDGISMVYTFDNAAAPSRRKEQYFEMLGNRSFYSDGWMASTTPGIKPWDRSHADVDAMTFKWELYNLSEDYAQGRDLAASNPGKLDELKRKFDAAAVRYNVYPLGSSLMNRFAPSNRPSPVAGRTSFTYYPGDTRYPENSFPGLRPGWSATAHVVVGDADAHGPLLVRGDHNGGYELALRGGVATFLYNPTGREQERVRLVSRMPLKPGAHDIRIEATRDTKGGPRAVTLTLSIDGKPADRRTSPVFYSVISGNSYVGRAGLGPLLPDEPTGPLTGATITSIDVQIEPAIKNQGGRQ